MQKGNQAMLSLLGGLILVLLLVGLGFFFIGEAKEGGIAGLDLANSLSQQEFLLDEAEFNSELDRFCEGRDHSDQQTIILNSGSYFGTIQGTNYGEDDTFHTGNFECTSSGFYGPGYIQGSNEHLWDELKFDQTSRNGDVSIRGHWDGHEITIKGKAYGSSTLTIPLNRVKEEFVGIDFDLYSNDKVTSAISLRLEGTNGNIDIDVTEGSSGTRGNRGHRGNWKVIITDDSSTGSYSSDITAHEKWSKWSIIYDPVRDGVTVYNRLRGGSSFTGTKEIGSIKNIRFTAFDDNGNNEAKIIMRNMDIYARELYDSTTDSGYTCLFLQTDSLRAIDKESSKGWIKNVITIQTPLETTQDDSEAADIGKVTAQNYGSGGEVGHQGYVKEFRLPQNFRLLDAMDNFKVESSFRQIDDYGHNSEKASTYWLRAATAVCCSEDASWNGQSCVAGS